jgi:hypothetical protein
MLISLCVPVMNRLEELKQSLPIITEIAVRSPQVQLVIVDYGSTDGTSEYIYQMEKIWGSSMDCRMTVRKLHARYYNSAHARNLCVQASFGEYIIQLSAEALPDLLLLPYIRTRIAEGKPVWMCEDTKFEGQYCGRFIVCKRHEFMESGGYDERFNLYGPEDKDICFRLHRRGGKFEPYPNYLCREIPTDNGRKLENLDKSGLPGRMWQKREMMHMMGPIFRKNIEDGLLVANPGKDWTKWI